MLDHEEFISQSAPEPTGRGRHRSTLALLSSKFIPFLFALPHELALAESGVDKMALAKLRH
jgi:hypothetical protein